ncbi:MAG: bifunctional phosphopantothenoylcysteine decarboxylase/phosphopantothenate--cysteine ligase CoaBC [Cyclobacteriaceae bacterium]|nr:bifunctional phosphopantothenoylcysteine decarboxylase/phosphopantothenate--cysteine ligase CoaBC [Cyclobacteriaceae bacterium]MCH8515517.1 bifunctional phosphopantothenoylcysteine decarboxylase/phosphopantothenate--cysteine ligase CoaBC [Cyclobacteriaceae bacterium]
MSIKDKNILLGVSGSIAAYKAALLVRLFVKAGANVQVIMSEDATQFITPLTLSTLSKNPVYTKFIKNNAGEWVNHVELGLWADLMIIAPATGKTLSSLAHGYSDNLLVATYLSARCPVYIAPAMDLDMYLHPSQKRNLEILSSYGNHIIEPESGELASGLDGKGRLAEPENILEAVANFFKTASSWSDKKVLITAGPTHEAIDPVRFIGNHSSGKMGYALAEEALSRGATVHLVSGPTSLSIAHPNLKITKVQAAQEMYNAASEHFDDYDCMIYAAAVADYRPSTVATEKIKKKGADMQIAMTPNVDIALSLGKIKKPHQYAVGFALETENEALNAQSKLERKNFDCIVLNSLRTEGAGFQHDTNQVTLYFKSNKKLELELKSKREIAKDIFDAIEQSIHS